MNQLPTELREIVGVRIRLNWRGNPITQVGRRQVQLRSIPDQVTDTGNVVWFDVWREDAIELAAFLKERCS